MARSGKPAHLIKNFAGQVYGAFSQDLVDHIESGLSKEHCDANKRWLEKISTAAATLPDSELFGKKIFQRCDAITKEYVEWNDGHEKSKNPPAEHRRKYHARIKSKVNKLSGTYRNRTALLEREADIKVYEAFYSATEDLIKSVPDLLNKVAETMTKFPTPK